MGEKQEPIAENSTQAEQKNNKWQSFQQEQSVTDDNEVEKSTDSLEHPTYEELEERLTLEERKAQDNWDKFLRAQAELDNIRRRAEKDVSNAYKYAQDKLLNALLPVVDSLERAVESCQGNEAHKVIAEGVELTLKLLLDTLEKQGVKQLNPKGEVFDPNFHEAISMQETQEVDSGCVLNVIQKGYKLHDRVLRPALIVVAK